MLIVATDLAEWCLVAATTVAAVAAVAASCAAFISDRTSRRLEASRRQLDYATWAMRITPLLHEHLDSPNDGLPPSLRSVVIELLELGAAHWRDEQNGLLGSDWGHMRMLFVEWITHPKALEAWPALRERGWPDGFRDYVDGVVRSHSARRIAER